MERETEFRRWRLAMGFTRRQAAEALGISPSHAANYDTGINRNGLGPAAPGKAVRIAMAALKERAADHWLGELEEIS